MILTARTAAGLEEIEEVIHAASSSRAAQIMGEGGGLQTIAQPPDRRTQRTAIGDFDTAEHHAQRRRLRQSKHKRERRRDLQRF